MEPLLADKVGKYLTIKIALLAKFDFDPSTHQLFDLGFHHPYSYSKEAAKFDFDPNTQIVGSVVGPTRGFYCSYSKETAEELYRRYEHRGQGGGSVVVVP